MKRIFKRLKDRNKRIAEERIDKLFAMAEENHREHPERSNRYVALARKIQMKYKVRMPSEYRRRFCRYCLHYLVPSVNLRVRLQGDHVVYYCLDCKRHMRFVHKGKKRQTRTISE